MKKIIITAIAAGSLLSQVAIAQVKTGTGFGFRDNVKVSVETDGDKIKDIFVVEHQDTEKYALPAFEALTEDIIAKQTLDVDDYAGATYSSIGFKEAVADALK